MKQEEVEEVIGAGVICLVFKDIFSKQSSSRRKREDEGEFFNSSDLDRQVMQSEKNIRKEAKKVSKNFSVTKKKFSKSTKKLLRSKLPFKKGKSPKLKFGVESDEFEEFMF